MIRARFGRTTSYFITCGACFLALAWLLFFPSPVSAHAILVRSTPAKDAVLTTAPSRIQMWFSERLNPTLTTAYVVNEAISTAQSIADPATHLDLHDAHVAAGDPTELDLSLKPDLPPAVYLVFFNTSSADDGHSQTGSFLFTIAYPDGSLPPSQGSLSGVSATSSRIDGLTLFSLLMIVLVELGTIFWVGAQFWPTFVLELAKTEGQEQPALCQEVARRFDRFFSIPTLLVLLFANIGTLIGQILVATGGQWSQALSFSVLSGLIVNSQFGIYWLAREIIILLALAVTISSRLLRSHFVEAVYSWANLVLGSALLIAVTLSGHAAAVTSNLVLTAVLVDWLHLLAASLWVGGMLYLATSFLPVLKGKVLKEQASTLLTMLRYYSPLAIVGVVLMGISGPFDATFHVLSWGQLFTTAYGLTLITKIFMVIGLMLISAVHVFFFRPRLQKGLKRYTEMLSATQQAADEAKPVQYPLTGQQAKTLEGTLQQQVGLLARTLRWEPLLGIAVVVCTAFLTIFAGTLQVASPAPRQDGLTATHSHGPEKSFEAVVKTTDEDFTATMIVKPAQQGSNTFVVRVLNQQGKLETNIGVSIYATQLDTNLGTATFNLQPDGNGNFSGPGDLSLRGRWRLRVEIRTPDTILHETQVMLTLK